MKTALLTSAGKLLIREKSNCDQEKVMTIKACGICQSDHKAFAAPPSGMKLPKVLGHEFVGILERDFPSQGLVKGTPVLIWPAVSCGSCRYCQDGRENLCPDVKIFGYHLDGGFQEEFSCEPDLLDQLRIFPVPEKLSLLEAVFAEPLACILNALAKVPFKPQKCMVTGLGVMGRLAIRVIKLRWPAKVFGYDLDPVRQKLASGECQPISDERVDLVLIAASSVAAFDSAIDLLAPGGMALLFSGMPRSATNDLLIPHNKIHQKEQHLVGAYGCTPAGTRQALNMIAAGDIEVADLISRKAGLADLAGLLPASESTEFKTIIC